jgi:hypothetical protein
LQQLIVDTRKKIGKLIKNEEDFELKQIKLKIETSSNRNENIGNSTPGEQNENYSNEQVLSLAKSQSEESENNKVKNKKNLDDCQD